MSAVNYQNNKDFPTITTTSAVSKCSVPSYSNWHDILQQRLASSNLISISASRSNLCEKQKLFNYKNSILKQKELRLENIRKRLEIREIRRQKRIDRLKASLIKKNQRTIAEVYALSSDQLLEHWKCGYTELPASIKDLYMRALRLERKRKQIYKFRNTSRSKIGFRWSTLNGFVEPDIIIDDESSEDEVDTNIDLIKKLVVNRCRTYKSDLAQQGSYKYKSKPVRNQNLFNKLKTMLIYLKRCRLGIISTTELFLYKYKNFANMKVELGDIPLDPICELGVEPQMEAAHGEEQDCVTKETTSNVVLATQKPVTLAEPPGIQPISKWWLKLSSNDMDHEYSDLTNRYLLFETFEWKVTDVFGALLKQYSLPGDFIRRNINTPNCLLFKNFSYWHGDIEIKLVINANQFQCGQLQVSFYYGAATDDKFIARNSIYSASHMNHVLLDAGSSNDAEISIPYRTYKPFVGIKQRVDDAANLDLGMLRIFVTGQLKSISEAVNKVDVSVFIKFSQSIFSGMCGPNIGIIEPQMLRSAFRVAEKMLDEFAPDENRDNPPLYQQPKKIYPISTPSMCLGDKIDDPMNPLRLVATGQTPHPGGVASTLDEMSYRYICGIYGLINTFEWNIDDPEGRVLKQLYASPIQPYWWYPEFKLKNTTGQDVDTIVYPPVSVISSCFNYWRGSLKLRLDFISTQFHTGRILVAYVPRVLSFSVTLENLKTCTHEIFDLQTVKQHTFVIPFVSDKPWWPRHDKFDNSGKYDLPHGKVYIVVLNKLINMSQVSKSITVNMYMCADTDYELSVPVAPTIGLGFNVDIIRTSSTYLTYLSNYGPPSQYLMIDTWHTLGTGKLIFRYGPGSDHITQWPNFDENSIYRLASPAIKLKAYQFENLEYLVHVIVPNDNHVYAAPFDTIENAEKYIKGRVDNGGKDNFDLLLQYSTGSAGQYPQNNVYYWSLAKQVKYYRTEASTARNNTIYPKEEVETLYDRIYTLDNSYVYAGVTILYFKNDVVGVIDKDDIIKTNITYDMVLVKKPLKESNDNFVIIEHQMDRNNEIDCSKVQILPKLNSTQGGRILFGEEFGDLKTLLRRYQPYCYLKDIEVNTEIEVADYIVPILPQGLNLTIDFEEFKNYSSYCRDGVIPIVASGYRFFRGSLRFRLLVNSTGPGHIWVQHRPDLEIKSLLPQKVDIKDGNRHLYNLFGSGYATVVQALTVNTIVDFEVPYYLPGQYGLLQRPKLGLTKDAVHYSLGHLLISFKSKIPASKCDIMLFYSMGDDMRFSMFQGFPAMLHLPSLINPKVENQGPDEECIQTDGFIHQACQYYNLDYQVERKKYYDWRRNEILVESQGLLDNVTEFFYKNSKAKVMDKVKQEIQNLDIGSITNTIDAVCVDADKSLRSMILNGIMSFFHTVINPNIKTLCLTIITILANIGLFAYDSIVKCYRALYNFVMKYLNPTAVSIERTSNELNEEGGVQGQSEDTDEEAALLSTCVAGFLSAMGCSRDLKRVLKERNTPDFFKLLRSDIREFAWTSNTLFRFFQNNIRMFIRLFGWVKSKIFNTATLGIEISDNYDKIKEWAIEVSHLTQPEMLKQIYISSPLQCRVFSAANIGQILLSHCQINNLSLNTTILVRACNNIIKLQDKLIMHKLSPPVRFEPFVLYLAGAPGIGKSFVASNLGCSMLDAINWKGYQQPIFVRTPGNPYWQNLQQNPICLFDDFHAFQDDQGIMDCAELMLLKSCATFNPPSAAVEDKNQLYNPLAVVLCSNYPYPTREKINVEALQRRRDMLVTIKLKSAYKDINDVDKSILNKFEHLDFFLHKNVIGKTASEQDAFVRVYNYTEFKAFLKEKWLTYYIKETDNYHQRLEELKRFRPDTLDGAEEHFDITNAKDLVVPDEFKDVLKLYKETKENVLAHTIVPHMDTVEKDRLEERYLPDEANPSTSEQHLQDVKNNLEAIKKKKNSVSDCIENIKVKIISKPVSKCIHDDLMLYSYDVPNKIIVWLRDNIYYKDKQTCGSGCKWSTDEGYNAWVVNYFRQACNLRTLQHVVDSNPEARSRFPAAVVNDNIALFVEADNVRNAIDFKNTPLGQELEENKKGLKSKLSKIIPAAWEIIYNVLWKLFKVTLLLGGIFVGVATIKNSYMGIRNYCEEKKLSPLGLAEVSSIKRNGVGPYGLEPAERYTALGKAHQIIPELEGVELSRSHNKLDSKIFTDQLSTSGDCKTPGKTQVGTRAVAKLVGQMSKQVYDNVITRIVRNTIFIKHVTPTGTISARCLGIVDRWFILLDHYYYIFKHRYNTLGGDFYFVVNDKSVIRFNLEDLLLRPIHNSAIIMCQSNVLQPFKNIINLIMPSTSPHKLNPDGVLVEIEVRNVRDPVYGHETARFDVHTHNLDLKFLNNITVPPPRSGDPETNVDSLFSYAMGYKGLCGSVLLSKSNTNSPIIGIHIAGLQNQNYGYSECLVKETFDQLDVRIKDVIEANILFDLEPIENCLLPLDTCVQDIGCVPNKFAHHDAGKSRLMHTECYNEIFESTYDWPLLHPQDERNTLGFSPMQVGCELMGNPNGPFNKKYLQEAFEDVKNKIISTCKPRRLMVGKLSLEEAIVGIKDNEFYEGLEWSTSEGFPFSSFRPKGVKDKRWLFDLEETVDGYQLNKINPMLIDCMNEKNKQRLEGYLPFTVFVDCLKDQKLPREKACLPGKTRIFSISPVDFTIQQKQYFGDFVAAFHASKIEMEHSLTIDETSLEWTRLANHLLSDGFTKILVGDYSKFGPTLNTDCVYLVYQILLAWYEFYGSEEVNFEEDQKIREMMGDEVRHALHLMFNLIYRVFNGAPSGNPLTTIINCIVNMLYIRIVWLVITATQVLLKYHSLLAFNKHVRCIVNGDDIIMSVSDEAAEFFNINILTYTFSKFNIKFTDANKQITGNTFYKINDSEVTFLKRNFKYDYEHHIWMAPLDRRSIEETCNWCWKHPNKREVSILACQAMCELAIGQGKDYYTNIRQRVINYWLNKRVHISIPSWELVFARCYGR